jgi:hypothetical protein
MVLSSYYKKLTSQYQQQLQTLMQISYKLKWKMLRNVTTRRYKDGKGYICWRQNIRKPKYTIYETQHEFRIHSSLVYKQSPCMQEPHKTWPFSMEYK